MRVREIAARLDAPPAVVVRVVLALRVAGDGCGRIEVVDVGALSSFCGVVFGRGGWWHSGLWLRVGEVVWVVWVVDGD